MKNISEFFKKHRRFNLKLTTVTPTLNRVAVLSEAALRKNLYITGRSGVGVTHLVRNLIRQSQAEGKGCLYLEGGTLSAPSDMYSMSLAEFLNADGLDLFSDISDKHVAQYFIEQSSTTSGNLEFVSEYLARAFQQIRAMHGVLSLGLIRRYAEDFYQSLVPSMHVAQLPSGSAYITFKGVDKPALLKAIGPVMAIIVSEIPQAPPTAAMGCGAPLSALFTYKLSMRIRIPKEHQGLYRVLRWALDKTLTHPVGWVPTPDVSFMLICLDALDHKNPWISRKFCSVLSDFSIPLILAEHMASPPNYRKSIVLDVCHTWIVFNLGGAGAMEVAAAKSMLGVLALAKLDVGEFYIVTPDQVTHRYALPLAIPEVTEVSQAPNSLELLGPTPFSSLAFTARKISHDAK